MCQNAINLLIQINANDVSAGGKSAWRRGQRLVPASPAAPMGTVQIEAGALFHQTLILREGPPGRHQRGTRYVETRMLCTHASRSSWPCLAPTSGGSTDSDGDRQGCACRTDSYPRFPVRRGAESQNRFETLPARPWRLGATVQQRDLSDQSLPGHVSQGRTASVIRSFLLFDHRHPLHETDGDLQRKADPARLRSATDSLIWISRRKSAARGSGGPTHTSTPGRMLRFEINQMAV